MTDARAHLQTLVGREIRTLTGGKPNRILRIEGDEVIVGTQKSPDGRPVPIGWLQDAVELLERRGEIAVDVETLGHRGAFVGAFLATLPDTVVRPTTPRRVVLARGPWTDERLDEVRKLVHEHLNASMIMVPLDTPLDPDMPISEALDYLNRHEFDLALLRTPEVRVIYRDRLQAVPEHVRGKPVKATAHSPRADRLIEHRLELGEVAKRLQADPVPLLVVGRDGPEYIVTRADFTRPAGQAGVLAVLAALDAQLDELLRPYGSEAWELLGDTRKEEIEMLVARAHRRSEEVDRLSYVNLRERLELVRELDLPRRLALNLGTEEQHKLVTAVRNDIAHGREPRSGSDVIEALEIAQEMLDAIDQVLRAVS